MRKTMFVLPFVLVVLFMVGCAKPPQPAIDAANAAVEAAKSAEASLYAGDSLRSAEDAVVQLNNELKTQEGKFALFRSYKKSDELAAAAKAAGEKAAADAKAGKEAAKAAASQMMTDAQALLAQAKELLDKAPKGKGTQADLEAMKADLAGVESTLADAQNSFNSEKYLDVNSKVEGAKAGAQKVIDAVNAAIEAKKGKR